MLLLSFFTTLTALFSSCTAFAFSASNDSTVIAPKPIYGQEIRVISYILDNRHYRRIKLDDSLSSVILDSYIEQLDDNRTYFLRSDIALFEKYRFLIDDKTRDADVSPAYAIYNVFRKRYFDRMAFAMDIINRDFDYSMDEYYEIDRSEKPWAESVEELDAIWRKITKNQALNLKLAGKSQDEIRETLRKRYARFAKNAAQFNSEDVFNVYANALTGAYDPHTNYFSPQLSNLFKQSMSLSLEGIGARLQAENDYTKVIEIIAGGPAQKSDKIHANDLIIGVGQGETGEVVDIIGWRVLDVVKLIKGPKGTTVRLQILPAKTGITGPVKEITLVREKIKLEDMAAKKKIVTYLLGGETKKIGVISLPSFYMDFDAYARGDSSYRSTTADVKKLIVELQEQGVEGIVMDLRNNGGGSLSEAINLTGLFIREGPVVQVKNARNKIDVGRDEDKEIIYDGPLVVMTNRFSASASEIFAGAIQDYCRGIIVGEPTYGKGTVQNIIDLSRFIDTKEEIGKLKITFQKFYRITGSSTQSKGVIPDVILPSAYDENQYREQSNLNALQWDIIQSATFYKATDVDNKIITDLNASYKNRVMHDTSLQKYISEMEQLKKSLAQTRVSLNEEKRKQDMKQDTLLQSETIGKEGELAQKKLDDDMLLKLNDEYLREGILVLHEFIERKTQ